MKIQDALQELKSIHTKLEYLSNASGLIHWDMQTGAPRKALADRGDLLSYLSGESYKLQTSERMRELIETLDGADGLSEIDAAMVRETKKAYERTKKVPEERMTAYVKAVSDAESVWTEAKGKNDWEGFRPYLETVMDFQKEMAGYYGYESNPYDALLDQYEPGVTVRELDEVFAQLRDAIVDLLGRIQKSGVKIDRSVLYGNFSSEKQREFSVFILERMGFDFEAGRLDISVHPFTTNFGNKDVRLTTFYSDSEISDAMFSSIHEGGHGIYEQNIPDTLKGTGLAGGVSMGIHESQSRFYENIIGRSEAFWTYFYPKLREIFPQFETIAQEDFYRAINAVEPSLIRTQADELTYSLHIIIRYELEKELMNGRLTVSQLPQAWNAKYKEYLGIEPPDYTQGVLQDTHWSGGMVGYFPSYALGNLYGAQIARRMRQDLPEMDEQIARGDLSAIREWLKEHVHRHGGVYTPGELIRKVTGEDLNAQYFIDYLNRKYSRIYEL